MSLNIALCLPMSDVAALSTGRMIVALSRTFVSAVSQFALCPVELQPSSANLLVTHWAKLEFCKIHNDPGDIEKLAHLTIWQAQDLHAMLQERYKLFLVCLRVFPALQAVAVPAATVNANKVGNFIKLPTFLSIANLPPVLSDYAFDQRKRQLINLEPPPYPELEALQCDIAHLASTNPDARALDNDLCAFLGWRDRATESIPDSDLNWIRTIADVGNSSDGHAFEKLVRKSLIKLGFTNSNQDHHASLDPGATGGAGGLDVYCEAPYPLVGECKASKHDSVPDGVAAQLIKLGNNHLGKAQFERSVKVIFAAGTLTDYAQRTARENQMSVLRPETLQRLVELKARYPGAINLLDLKACLDTSCGEEADAAVDRYIDDVRQKLRLRAQLVEATKRLTKPHRTQLEVVEIRTRYEADFGTELRDPITHELLIELSSPLAGYLGRVEGDSLRSDRFYFLRDLVVE